MQVLFEGTGRSGWHGTHRCSHAVPSPLPRLDQLSAPDYFSCHPAENDSMHSVQKGLNKINLDTRRWKHWARKIINKSKMQCNNRSDIIKLYGMPVFIENKGKDFLMEGLGLP